jgi:hypothetical protein
MLVEGISLAASVVAAFFIALIAIGYTTDRDPLGRGTIAVTAALTLGVYGLLAAAYYWRDFRRWQLRKAGRCEKCGYDRSGLANDAPCPECGKA